MKAWRVEDTQSYEGGCTVVFAETRGKAHDLARYTDCCEDAEWNDIRVTRMPELDDKWEPGKKEMDWYKTEDRIELVKLGWYCLDVDREYCIECEAAEWCGNYQDWKDEFEEAYE